MEKFIYIPSKDIETQGFGKSTFSDNYASGLHSGLDFRAKHGSPIYASIEGIAHYEIDDHGGHGVVILSNKRYLVEGQETYVKVLNWHMCDPFKEPQYKSVVFGRALGVYVKAGDVIGFADNTGISTGDHDHFGLKPVYQDSNGEWQNTHQDNGTAGAIDPTPYFNGLYAEDLHKTPTLKRGDKGIEVSVLQAKLMAKYYNIKIDGDFGLKTEAIVKDFQTKNHLTPDGVVGPKTQALL